MASCGYLWYTKILKTHTHTNICFSSFLWLISEVFVYLGLCGLCWYFPAPTIISLFLTFVFFVLKNSYKQSKCDLPAQAHMIQQNHNWSNQWVISVNTMCACTHTYLLLLTSFNFAVTWQHHDRPAGLWLSTSTTMDTCGRGAVATMTDFSTWSWLDQHAVSFTSCLCSLSHF